MWYLWRMGPDDREGQYMSSYPSLDAITRVVTDIAEGKKLVRRVVDDGVQFTVKSHETTLEALLQGVTYYAKNNDRKTPVARPMQFVNGRDGRAVEPGGKLPSPYLKINP